MQTTSARVEDDAVENLLAVETVDQDTDIAVAEADISATAVAVESQESATAHTAAAEDSVEAPALPAITTLAPQTPATPPAPSFTRQSASGRVHPRTSKWQWAALVGLSLLLVIQVLIADRARLAEDAGWRPVVAGLCGLVGCTLPPWHQPGALAMLSRDVRPIAGTPGGLGVRATFRNDARWAQAWPVLLLSLSDADGHVLGARAFAPEEYLDAAATQTELAPGQSARISLEIHEPGPDVVAFSFDFR